MPTTLAGLTLYVLMLVPGLVFVFAREAHRPTLRRSVFRETATVVFVSAACVAFVAGLAAIASLLWPWLRNVVQRLALDDTAYIARNLPWLFLVGCALIAVASVTGWVLGGRTVHAVWSRRPWVSDLIPRDASAWGVAFDLGSSDERVLVGIQLKTGWWWEGTLYAFDNSADADPTRTITLTGDLASRAPGATKAERLTGYGLIILQASEIDYLVVGYEGDDPATSPGDDA